MEIKERYQSMRCMSPWGFRFRPFTESKTNTSEYVVRNGSTLPDVARAFYGKVDVHPISLNAGFMGRDLFKNKDYEPGKEDPFVMRDLTSMQTFFTSCKGHVVLLTELAKKLSLPIKKDDKRTNLDIIDPDALFEWLNPSHDKHQTLLDNWDDIVFIMSNQDITRKYCIVRAVPVGWWASSYAGRPSGNLPTFMPAIRALVRAMRILRASSKYEKIRSETEPDIGDPLDTNVGYPFFSAEVNKDGVPISKLKVAHAFSGLGIGFNDFTGLKKRVDEMCPEPNLKGFPLAMAPLRRQQPGYKFAHMFKTSGLGITSENDWAGFNTVRIAWMAPYLENLLLSPLQVEWKVLRKMMPGVFHDGPAKKLRNDFLRKNKKTLRMAEADYTNYDRFMPFDIFEEFTRQYLKGHKREKLLNTMVQGLFHDVPIIWPDGVNGDGKHGWIFTPKDLGLFSGLKITSEVGTFVNTIVNLATIAESRGMNEDQLVSYMTMYKDADSGSKREYFWVMSDDTLLIADNPQGLYKQCIAFKKFSDLAGLKGSLQIGDRFLMRHCEGGRDTPVPARTFQNSVSNESAVTDPLIFRVGLAMRTEGLLGQRTYDPFQIGKILSVTASELIFSYQVLVDLRKQISTSAQVDARSLEYIDTLITAAKTMTIDLGKGRSIAMRPSYGSALDKHRVAFISELAARELEMVSTLKLSSFKTLIYQMYKDRHNPASNRVLEEIMSLSSSSASELSVVVTKEREFYKFIMGKLNIPTNLSDW
jgi:hypothetical protein